MSKGEPHERPVLRLVSDKPDDNENSLRDFKERQYSYSECRHRSITVDPILRTVKCQICGERLDPVECLLYIIREDRVAECHHDAMKVYRAEQAEKNLQAKKKKRAPLIELLGEEVAMSLSDGGGFQTTDNRWVDDYTHRTGAAILISRGKRFWQRIGPKWNDVKQVSGEEAKAIFLDKMNAAPILTEARR